MARFENPLDNVKIASPCSQDWNSMIGNNRQRFCGECNLNVYNLSGMSKTEAENLILNAEGRLCVRFYKRADGSVITENCPVGWARVKQRAKVFVTAAASLIFTFLGAVGFQSMLAKSTGLTKKFPIPLTTPTPAPLMGTMPISTPTQQSAPKYTPEMGETVGRMQVNPVRTNGQTTRK